MGFQLSPGVNITEIDLTTIVPAVSTTVGAFVGVFPWGPNNERELITSELDLEREFGKPIIGYNEETWWTLADFMAYGDQCWVVNVSNGNTAASSANTATQIKAKYPGSYGNSLKVFVADADNFANSSYSAFFDTGPDAGGDNINLIVVDEDGTFTGIANNVVERYINLSLVDGDQTEDGSSNYFADRLQQSSRYITVDDADAITFATELKAYFTATGAEYLTSFTGGTNGDDEETISQGDLRTGFDLFESAETVDISLVIMGKARGTVHDAELANYVVQNICEDRLDCVAFLSPAYDDVVNAGGNELDNVIDFAGNLTSSSYAVIDSGYKYRYDKYNDKYIYTPLNGDTAGLCVRTDNLRDPWWSPAGYNRGIIKNIVKLPFNPNKAERDQLYKNRVNPVISQRGQGTFLFGDKTALAKPSAFDRINVRRLFIVLEKAIAVAAKYTLFEFNDEFTRAQFVNLVEPFLRDVEGRRGIYDFRVVCDETNNIPEVIDRNEFIGDIYIKPARSINFIQLNFIAVRTGVEFEEVVGKF